MSFWIYNTQVIRIDLQNMEKLLLNFSDLNYLRRSNLKELSSGVSYALRVATLVRESRVAF